MKSKLTYFSLGVVCCFIVFVCLDRCSQDAEYKVLSKDSITVVRIDTVTITQFVPIKEIIVDSILVYIPVAEKDTSRGGVNTITPISLPITRKYFKTADYELVLQGYNPELVSMRFFRKETINNINTIIQKQQIQEFYASIGASASRNIIMPYIKLGCDYRRWGFYGYYGYDVLSQNSFIGVGVEWNFLRFGR